MVDVREDILARLLEIMATIPNIRSAARNNVDIPEDKLPAAIVFDGDEETDGGTDMSRRPPNRSRGAAFGASKISSTVRTGWFCHSLHCLCG